MPDDPKRTRRGTYAPGTSGNPLGKRPANSGKMDGWEGFYSGIGTATHDKRVPHEFVPTSLSYQQLLDIVEGDDLGEKAVKGPIDDATRQGFEISITDEGDYDPLKRGIDRRLKELKVMKVIKKALYQKRALGGSAILLGVKDYQTLDKPINQNTLRGVSFLSVLEPMSLQPYEWYDDPTADKFGEVKLWQLAESTVPGFGAQQGRAVKTAGTATHTRGTLIHESRLIILNNDKLSVYSANRNPAGDYWGLSILVKLYDVLRDFNISWAAAGLLVTDFSQGVFSIEGLMNLVANDKDNLVARMQALELGRSVARSIMIDKDHEGFERKSTNVSGLPDLLYQLSRRLAAAIDIPLSVLMGGAEKTDDAEMSNELRYYYDKCVSIQNDEITPILMLIIEIIIRGLRVYNIPDHLQIKWHPLWQLTDEQKANARLAQARVDAIYIEHGVLDPQAVAVARFSGEYSYDTILAADYQAPGFMALPPMGVLVDGLDPSTGLPPGVQPPMAPPGSEKKPPPNKVRSGAGNTGAHAVKGYARRNPVKKNMAKSNYSQAGGATPGKLRDFLDSIATFAQLREATGHCGQEHETMDDMEACEHCTKCDSCRSAQHGLAYARAMERAGLEIEDAEFSSAAVGEVKGDLTVWVAIAAEEHCGGEHDGEDECEHCQNCDGCAKSKKDVKSTMTACRQTLGDDE